MLITGLETPKVMTVMTVQKFMSFQLGVQDIGLLPLEQVAEIFPLSLKEILPVPQVPNHTLGIYHWREEMLWLVDLNSLLGYSPVSISQKNPLMTIVLQHQDKILGLIVPQIYDIESCDLSNLKSIEPGLFSAQLTTYLSGYFLTEENKMMRCLNPQALFSLL